MTIYTAATPTSYEGEEHVRTKQRGTSTDIGGIRNMYDGEKGDLHTNISICY